MSLPFPDERGNRPPFRTAAVNLGETAWAKLYGHSPSDRAEQTFEDLVELAMLRPQELGRLLRVVLENDNPQGGGGNDRQG